MQDVGSINQQLPRKGKASPSGADVVLREEKEEWESREQGTVLPYGNQIC